MRTWLAALAGLMSVSLVMAIAALGSLPPSPSLPGGDEPDIVFITGLVNNSSFPFLIKLEATAEIGGTGFGFDADAVVPATACNFDITSATEDGNVITLSGTVTTAVNAANVGASVTIIAEELDSDVVALTLIFDPLPAGNALTFTGFGILED